MNRRAATRLLGSLVGLGGVAFSLTLLSRSMRSVEAIGGSCASGGPYQIQHQCPKGIGGLLPLSIFGGLLFLGLFAVCAGANGRSMVLLVWPALFLSLGWNFIDYGLHLTTSSGSGVSAGFLVPGVLFIVMGAVPLVLLAPRLWGIVTGRSEPSDIPSGAPGPVPFVGATSGRFGPPPPSAPMGGTSLRFSPPPPNASAAAPIPSGGEDIASELERLASLHRRRELTDAEYEAAKSQAIANPKEST